MEAGGDVAPMPGAPWTDGKPAGVVEEGFGDEAGGFPMFCAREGANSIRLRTYVRIVHWRRQGDLGELSAMEWFASKGALVCVPVGHSPDFDFVAVQEERLLRVQVKTCVAFRSNRWPVAVCTRGGNQSWSGLVKRFDAAQCDYLFAVVGDGRRWCIPSAALEGGTRIALGGPKYAPFEVERGRPLPSSSFDETASTIVSPDPRGDVRAAKGARL
jgi:PD-(D/E)XK endonuclease